MTDQSPNVKTLADTIESNLSALDELRPNLEGDELGQLLRLLNGIEHSVTQLADSVASDQMNSA